MFLEVLVPHHHVIHDFLPLWKEDLLPVIDNIFSFMSIDILTLWSRLVTITKCLKIPTCCFVADITFNSIFFFDIHVVEKVHQLVGSHAVSKRQKVNADFIYQIFINQELLVPISIWVNRKDTPISQETTIQLTKPSSAVFPLAHPNCCLTCRGTPFIVGTGFLDHKHMYGTLTTYPLL